MPEKLLELLMPSRLEYLGVLAKLVEGLQGPLGLSDEETFAVSTALIEAGTNAVQHGHTEDASPVRVTLQNDGDRLVLGVHDQGLGFDISRVDENVTSLDHLFNSRGRGIFIMRSLMDEVNFSFGEPRGTQVTMVMRRKANGR